MGIECFRVQSPKGMDANEYARKVTPAAKSLGVLLNKAEWLGKGQRAVGRVAPRVWEPVMVAEPGIEPEPAEAKAAAKGKKIEDELPEPDPIAATMPLPSASTVAATEEVISLAAEAEPVAPAEPSAAPAPTIDVAVEMRGEDIFLEQGSRRYRVRGLNKNLSYELLKVNVLVSGATPRGEQAFHVDTLDLYSARQRGVFIKQAAEELGIKEEIIRRDLGRVLLKL
jgi:DNA primase